MDEGVTLTLILTLMRPGEGVWQTVDARVTKGGRLVNDFADKQLSIHRADGTLLLAYTGLAEVYPSGESMFDWIRSTIRGVQRNSEGDLIHLQERLDRDVAGSPYWRVPLIIVAAGILGTRPDQTGPLQQRRMARWIISNLRWPNGPTQPPRVVRSFDIGGEFVDEPRGFSAGSGRDPVSRSPTELLLLRRSLAYRPNRQEDYLGLLAAVNRRVAPLCDGSVSPWCSGWYLPETGVDLRRSSYRERGDPEPPDPSPLPSILFGLDTTDSGRHMRRQMEAFKQGLPPPPDLDSSSGMEPRP